MNEINKNEFYPSPFLSDNNDGTPDFVVELEYSIQQYSSTVPL